MVSRLVRGILIFLAMNIAVADGRSVALAQNSAPPRIDFGTVISGSYMPRRVTVTNTTTEPIRPLSFSIPNSSDVCSRVTAQWTKPWLSPAEAWLKPGEYCSYDVAPWMKHQGVCREAAFIVPFVDLAGHTVNAQIEVSARVQFNTAVHPDRADLGRIGEGCPASAILTITRYADESWKILAVKDTVDELTTEFHEIQRDGEQVKYLITVHLSEKRKLGELAEYLTVETSDATLPVFQLYVQGSVRPLLKKPIVRMKDSSDGQRRALLILSTESPTRLESVTSSGASDTFAYRFKDGARETHLLEVAIREVNAEPQELTDSVLIKFANRPEPETLKLTFLASFDK